MPKKLHLPIFRFDSSERFLPLAAESVEKVPATMVGLDEADHGPVSLEALPPAGGRMNFPPNPEDDEERMREEGLGGVGYRRQLQGGGLTWVQYWLWYLYNPKTILGVTGKHEGDWEFVQIGYAGDQPICVTASQHHSAGARMWWDVEREAGRPIIYVALGSHANYFDPPHGIPEIEDEGDGNGAELRSVTWRDFGDWSTWPGLWGNSRGPGNSPQSPGCQGDRWVAPHRYHSRGKR